MHVSACSLLPAQVHTIPKHSSFCTSQDQHAQRCELLTSRSLPRLKVTPTRSAPPMQCAITSSGPRPEDSHLSALHLLTATYLTPTEGGGTSCLKDELNLNAENRRQNVQQIPCNLPISFRSCYPTTQPIALCCFWSRSRQRRPPQSSPSCQTQAASNSTRH